MYAKLTLPFVTFISFLFLFGLSCNFNPSQILPEQTMDSLPPAISSRTIPKDFEPNLVWRKNQINIRRGFSPSSGLIVGYGYVAFVNFLGGPLSQINQLDVLDAQTGKTQWQSERFPTHEDVAISQDRAFVLLRQGSPLNIYNLNSDGKSIASLI